MKKISLALIIIGVLFFTKSALAAQITVDSNSDTQVTDGGCTLREAIANANNDSDGTGGDCVAGSGADTIIFDTAMTIVLTGGVLQITSEITVDGTSGGLLGNCPTKELDIVISGESNGSSNIFLLDTGSDGSVIKGFVLQNAGLSGIRADASTNIQILCNMFGLSQSGDALAINGAHGISLVDTDNIQIGGSGAGEGNIITGNDQNGINLDHAINTTILGNWIGLNRSGDGIFTAQEVGISVSDGAGLSDGLTIGGPTAGHRNIITGNNEIAANGLHSDSGVSDLIIQGNYWGTASDLTTVISINPNTEGDHFEIDTVTNFSITDNVFAGNGGLRGIHVMNSDTGIIQRNFVGVADDGVTSLVAGSGFIENPVSITNSTNIQFGGVGAGEYNIVGDSSGAAWSLVSLSSNNRNSTYYGNFIGVGSDGTTDLSGANTIGITFSGNDETLVFGGTGAGQSNIVANSLYGIISLYDNTTIIGNTIKDNTAGVLVADSVIAMGLSSSGVLLRNSIYGNDTVGIDLSKDTDGDVFGMDENIGQDPNDHLDTDTGPNNYINHPILISATQNGLNVDITYMLDVPVSVNPYHIEFFSNPSGLDASGFGQGELYEDSDEQTVSSAGPQIFTATIANAVATNGITATVTDCTNIGCTTFGGTSEFSNGITATGAGIDMATASGSQTALVSNGPYHIIKSGVYLGASVGTDTVGSVDASDKDGVTFDAATYVPSATVTTTVTASANGYMNAWIDGDANGTFETQIFFVNNAVTTGSNTFVFTAPSTDGTYNVRFRYTDYAPTDLEPTGEALNGEVEDYSITVATPAVASSGGIVHPGKVCNDTKASNFTNGPGYGDASVCIYDTPATTTASTYKFTRTLRLGMKGEDIRQLQIYLNTHGYPVSTTGVGSRGKETTYFGKATMQALIRFQEGTMMSVLKSLGFTKGTGIFGPATMKVVK